MVEQRIEKGTPAWQEQVDKAQVVQRLYKRSRDFMNHILDTLSQPGGQDRVVPLTPDQLQSIAEELTAAVTSFDQSAFMAQNLATSKRISRRLTESSRFQEARNLLVTVQRIFDRLNQAVNGARVEIPQQRELPKSIATLVSLLVTIKLAMILLVPSGTAEASDEDTFNQLAALHDSVETDLEQACQIESVQVEQVDLSSFDLETARQIMAHHLKVGSEFAPLIAEEFLVVCGESGMIVGNEEDGTSSLTPEGQRLAEILGIEIENPLPSLDADEQMLAQKLGIDLGTSDQEPNPPEQPGENQTITLPSFPITQAEFDEIKNNIGQNGDVLVVGFDITENGGLPGLPFLIEGSEADIYLLNLASFLYQNEVRGSMSLFVRDISDSDENPELQVSIRIDSDTRIGNVEVGEGTFVFSTTGEDQEFRFHYLDPNAVPIPGSRVEFWTIRDLAAYLGEELSAEYGVGLLNQDAETLVQVDAEGRLIVMLLEDQRVLFTHGVLINQSSSSVPLYAVDGDRSEPAAQLEPGEQVFAVSAEEIPVDLNESVVTNEAGLVSTPVANQESTTFALVSYENTLAVEQANRRYLLVVNADNDYYWVQADQVRLTLEVESPSEAEIDPVAQLAQEFDLEQNDVPTFAAAYNQLSVADQTRARDGELPFDTALNRFIDEGSNPDSVVLTNGNRVDLETYETVFPLAEAKNVSDENLPAFAEAYQALPEDLQARVTDPDIQFVYNEDEQAWQFVDGEGNVLGAALEAEFTIAEPSSTWDMTGPLAEIPVPLLETLDAYRADETVFSAGWIPGTNTLFVVKNSGFTQNLQNGEWNIQSIEFIPTQESVNIVYNELIPQLRAQALADADGQVTLAVLPTADGQLESDTALVTMDVQDVMQRPIVVEIVDADTFGPDTGQATLARESEDEVFVYDHFGGKTARFIDPETGNIVVRAYVGDDGTDASITTEAVYASLLFAVSDQDPIEPDLSYTLNNRAPIIMPGRIIAQHVPSPDIQLP